MIEVKSADLTSIIALGSSQSARARSGLSEMSRDISDKPDRALALCDDPNAMIEVKSADLTSIIALRRPQRDDRGQVGRLHAAPAVGRRGRGRRAEGSPGTVI